MQRIKIDDPQVVSEAIKILKTGGIIVYPTDTLYGFGVDATNDKAINKLNRIKKRRGPISVLVSDIDTAIGWMDISIEQRDLIPFYLGGQKTLIVSVKEEIVSPLILGDANTLGMRIPDHAFCFELSDQYFHPITTTSVNRTGEEPLNDPDLIVKEFVQDIDLIIDAGTLPSSTGSTIYKLTNDKITIIKR